MNSARAHPEYTPESKENETTLHKLHLFRPHSPLKYKWHIITEGKEDVESIEPDSICLRQENIRRPSAAAATLWCTAAYFKGLSAVFRSPSLFCGIKGRGARNRA